MTNNHNLAPAEFAAIEALTGEQLKAIRANLQLDKFEGTTGADYTREAVAQYVADGGDIADLLS